MIDTTTNTVVDTIVVGFFPVSVAITPNGALAYVANAASSTVSVIDLITNFVVDTIAVGFFPFGVTITPDGALVYVANTLSDNISVIDLVTNIVVGTVAAGVEPLGVAITPLATNEPPVAEADLIPIDVEEDEGLFEIVATATDPDDNLDTVTAVIVLPSIDGLDIELKQKNKIQIEVDLEEREAEIKGSDPDALLAEILQFGGLLVEDGDLVKIEINDDLEYELKFKKGILKIEAPEVTLRVTGTDTEGLSDTATANPLFEPDGDDDDDDDDD